MLQGWVVIGAETSTVFPLPLSVGDCDGKGLVPWMEPLLVFKLRGRHFAAAALSYYEGEGSQLYEFTKSGVVSQFQE